MYVLRLGTGVWYASWKEGDPPRTLVRANAKKYYTRKIAERDMKKAREFRPFKDAKIIPI